MSVQAEPDRPLRTQRAGRGMCQRRTDPRIGTEVRKPIPGEPGEVDMMCAAARGALETACRCVGHFRSVIWSPLGPYTVLCTVNGLSSCYRRRRCPF